MILGKKIGMTRIFDEQGRTLPVTVIEAGPCLVIQVKSKEKNGYQAIQLGFGQKRQLKKPESGHLKKSGAKSRWLRESKIEGEMQYKLGDQVKVDIFKPNDLVQAIAISKGKGFAGVIKRHGFSRGPESHGSDHHRAPGSIGSAFPQRVIKGRKMPGHLGAKKVTNKGLKVIEVDPEKNLLVIKGAVPGPKNSLLVIKGQK